MFNVDFNNIVELLLPPFLRKTKIIAWLKALVKPLIDLYTTFMAYRQSVIYLLSFTGQVIYLEKLLNDTYNNGTSGIIIVDGNTLDFPYLFNKSEGVVDIYLYNLSENEDPFYLYNKSEFGTQIDFIVKVPALLYSQLQLNNNQGLNNMTALITKYKLAGKRFIIQSL